MWGSSERPFPGVISAGHTYLRRLPADQTFRRVGPMRRLFPEIRFKGRCRRAPHELLFLLSLVSACWKGSVSGGSGSIFPVCCPGPSVPLRGFLRHEKQGKFERQLNRRGNCVLGASAGLARGGSRAVGPSPQPAAPPRSGESRPQPPTCLCGGHGAGQEGRLPLRCPVLLRNRGTMGTVRSRPVSGGPE